MSTLPGLELAPGDTALSHDRSVCTWLLAGSLLSAPDSFCHCPAPPRQWLPGKDVTQLSHLARRSGTPWLAWPHTAPLLPSSNPSALPHPEPTAGLTVPQWPSLCGPSLHPVLAAWTRCPSLLTATASHPTSVSGTSIHGAACEPATDRPMGSALRSRNPHVAQPTVSTACWPRVLHLWPSPGPGCGLARSPEGHCALCSQPYGGRPGSVTRNVPCGKQGCAGGTSASAASLTATPPPIQCQGKDSLCFSLAWSRVCLRACMCMYVCTCRCVCTPM